jgi:hypothetical protein
LRRRPCNYENMAKRSKKSIVAEESEPESGGIAAAIAQDIELTAEQIKNAAQRAVVAVEKIAGIKRARKSSKPGKSSKPRKVVAKKPAAKKVAPKKVQRKVARAKAVAVKAVKRKTPKSTTKK